MNYYKEIDKFDKIKRVTREQLISYLVIISSLIVEAIEMKKICKKTCKSRSRIFRQNKDYQIPLNDERKDKLGDVDLVSYNEKTKTLFLIELKYKRNKETLLRASLEIFTYYKSADIDKLKVISLNLLIIQFLR